jgi:antitoxin (DNA-binding transcriptional repressor) of toxin-antitoxin stability system
VKRVELRDASEPLAVYAKQAAREPVLVLRGGRPVAAVVPMTAQEWEDWVVTHQPDLVAATKRSRERYRRQGGLSLDEAARTARRPAATRRRAPKATPRGARLKR